MTAKLRWAPERLQASIDDSLERYRTLRAMPASTDAERAALFAAFRSWDERNQRLLDSAFAPVPWHATSPKSDYATLQGLEWITLTELPSEKASDLLADLDERARRLDSIKNDVEFYELAEPADRSASSPGDSNDETTGTVHTDQPQSGRSIFLVHGRDRAAKEEVARFIEKVSDDDLIVLEEQPHVGRTIIEKLEGYLPESSYVVVIMTGDDEGRLRGDAELNARARQNVIFELGWAIGKVGRQNVAVLYEDGVELLSDYYGVGYIGFDASGGWKLKLVGELKAVGFTVDANRIT
ncbi:nucleotide-binding protein [Nocardioides sp. cx-169]|uniref:TIR domain-containing protein n=1 Tax=Nocardioides sp. cx-169 TaxID=2899080 RepID=UPI001E36869E|nr:nucleotide-binding protein [Nocardioides sp. cx-169]MCD4533564.1 nucleotide-binding protein [Nocardioides sp. cx-169]